MTYNVYLKQFTFTGLYLHLLPLLTPHLRILVPTFIFALKLTLNSYIYSLLTIN